jgi:oxygen-independent coproporphyrinogen-3 oxidase
MNNGQPSGLYLHVPFCRSKCAYCAFYSIPDVSLVRDWLKGMVREMAHYGGVFPPFDTLYLGGGTPSVLDDAIIASLLEEAFRRFPFCPNPEITLEANPDDLYPARLSFYRGLGINRLSIGAQSFDDEDLSLLGRRHTADQTRRVLQAARDSGFENVSVDLIMGVPNQRSDPLGRWLTTLKEVVSFGPEHLSCYLLTYENDTPLEKLMRRGNFQPLSEEDERALFLLTSGYLKARGYVHYEVSNFARSDAHRSRHNSKYWRHVPYLGLGPSAHSFLGDSRWWNVRSVSGYCEMLAGAIAPVAGRETLSADQIHLEQLSLGLRTVDGISRELLIGGEQTEATLSALRREGLIRIDSARVFPTPKGYLLSDSLPLLFLG